MTSEARGWDRQGAMAGFTALCTVLVALSAFLSARTASNSDDAYAESALALNDANYLFAEGSDSLVERTGADRACVIGLVVEGAEGSCEGLEELEAIVADDPLFQLALENQAVADERFETGLDQSGKSVGYQAALVLFAVALALSAWAALPITISSRRLFSATAVGALIAGLVRLITI